MAFVIYKGARALGKAGISVVGRFVIKSVGFISKGSVEGKTRYKGRGSKKFRISGKKHAQNERKWGAARKKH